MFSSPAHPVFSWDEPGQGGSSCPQEAPGCPAALALCSQGTFPDLSAQTTAKHLHSMKQQRSLTWETARGGLRFCLYFVTENKGDVMICFITVAKPSTAQAAVTNTWGRALAHRSCNPRKKQGQPRKTRAERQEQVRLVTPAGTAHSAPMARALTWVIGRKTAIFSVVRWEEHKTDL